MLRPGTRIREYECAENNVDEQRYEDLRKDPSLYERKKDANREIRIAFPMVSRSF